MAQFQGDLVRIRVQCPAVVFMDDPQIKTLYRRWSIETETSRWRDTSADNLAAFQAWIKEIVGSG